MRYWASSSVLGEDNSFQEKEVITGSRLINKLWNLARFISMNRADYEPAAKGATHSNKHRLLDILQDVRDDKEGYRMLRDI